MKNITPCLWFDRDVEEAAAFYTAIFPNSRVDMVTRHAEGAAGPAVTLMTFHLDGQAFMAFSAKSRYAFSPSFSLVVDCKDQEEIDYYWAKLSEGGKEEQCGWLRDKFGVAWQIVPAVLFDMLEMGDDAARDRVRQAFYQMVKYDIAALEKAYNAK